MLNIRIMIHTAHDKIMRLNMPFSHGIDAEGNNLSSKPRPHLPRFTVPPWQKRHSRSSIVSSLLVKQKTYVIRPVIKAERNGILFLRYKIRIRSNNDSKGVLSEITAFTRYIRILPYRQFFFSCSWSQPAYHPA